MDVACDVRQLWISRLFDRTSPLWRLKHSSIRRFAADLGSEDCDLASFRPDMCLPFLVHDLWMHSLSDGGVDIFVEHFGRIADEDTKAPPGLRLLSHFVNGRYDKCVDLELAGMEGDSLLVALAVKANSLRALDRCAEALDFLKASLALPSVRTRAAPFLSALLGDLLLQMGHWHRALSALRLTSSQDATDALSLLNMAMVAVELSSFSECAEVMERVLKLAPPASLLYKDLHLHALAVQARVRNEPSQSTAIRALENELLSAAVSGYGPVSGLLLLAQTRDYASCAYMAALSQRSEPAIHRARVASLQASGDDAGALRLALSGVEQYPNSPSVLYAAADLCKSVGRLEQACTLAARAVQLCPGDPTLCFNYALMLDEIGRPEAAADLLERRAEQYQPAEMVSANHYALFLLLVKLHYVTGRLDEAVALLRNVMAFEESVRRLLSSTMATHWAYVYMLDKLLTASGPPPPLTDGEAKPLWFLGDSHILTYAYRLVDTKRRRFAKPLLVTGLRAYDWRPGAPLSSVIVSLQARLRMVAVSTHPKAVVLCGEIDCRDSLHRAVAKGRYPDLESAVRQTVTMYVAGLRAQAQQHLIRLLVHPVPPAARSRPAARDAAVLFNAALRQALPLYSAATEQELVVFLDIERQLADGEGFMRADLLMDGYHMNAGCVSVISGLL